jgi:UDP-glucose:(heptosyl)LPS alpha-1,3-glucosyltransferase
MPFMPKIAAVIPKYGLVGGAEQFAAQLTGRLCSRHQETFQVFANRRQSHTDPVGLHKISIISCPKLLTAIGFSYFNQSQSQRHNFPLVPGRGMFAAAHSIIKYMGHGGNKASGHVYGYSY